MTKRNSLRMVIVCLAAALVLPAARAGAEIENVRIPLDLEVEIPCANGGAGETVLLTGDLHLVMTFVVNRNTFRSRFHAQPQGVTGVGSVSGDRYNATGVTQGETRTSLRDGKAVVDFVDNFRIIGQRPGNNFLFHANIHIFFDANGDFTVTANNARLECR